MRRSILAVLLVAIVAFSIIGWIVYCHFNQGQEPLEPVTKVEIAELQWITPSEPVPDWEGLFLRNMVNVTIQNSGTTNVTGLTLNVGAFLNGSEVLHSTGFNKDIDVFPAGETLEISEWVYSYVAFRPEGAECVGTLLQAEVVLDSIIIPITWE